MSLLSLDAASAHPNQAPGTFSRDSIRLEEKASPIATPQRRAPGQLEEVRSAQSEPAAVRRTVTEDLSAELRVQDESINDIVVLALSLAALTVVFLALPAV